MKGGVWGACVGCVVDYATQGSLAAAGISLARASHLPLRMDLLGSPSRPSALLRAPRSSALLLRAPSPRSSTLLRVHSRSFAFVVTRFSGRLKPSNSHSFSRLRAAVAAATWRVVPADRGAVAVCMWRAYCAKAPGSGHGRAGSPTGLKEEGGSYMSVQGQGGSAARPRGP